MNRRNGVLVTLTWFCLLTVTSEPVLGQTSLGTTQLGALARENLDKPQGKAAVRSDWYLASAVRPEVPGVDAPVRIRARAQIHTLSAGAGGQV